MGHLKGDLYSLLEIYKLYAVHFITQQAVSVSEMLRKRKRKSRAGNPQNDDAEDSDFTDYSDGDFNDLLTSHQIEHNIKVFYDRIHELINPIEHERLKLDSVAQIKSSVKTFYQTKQKQCTQLLENLDQMRHERRYVMDLKTKQFNDSTETLGNLCN